MTKRKPKTFTEVNLPRQQTHTRLEEILRRLDQLESDVNSIRNVLKLLPPF